MTVDSLVRVESPVLEVTAIVIIALLVVLLASIWILIYFIYKHRSKASASSKKRDEEQQLGLLKDRSTDDSSSITIGENNMTIPHIVTSKFTTPMVLSKDILSSDIRGPDMYNNKVISDACNALEPKKEHPRSSNCSDIIARAPSNGTPGILASTCHDFKLNTSLPIELQSTGSSATPFSRIGLVNPFADDINRSGRTTYIDDSEDSDMSEGSSLFDSPADGESIATVTENACQSRLQHKLGPNFNSSSILRSHRASADLFSTKSTPSPSSTSQDKRKLQFHASRGAFNIKSPTDSTASPDKMQTPPSTKLTSALNSTINLSEQFELCSLRRVNLDNTDYEEDGDVVSPLKHKQGNRIPQSGVSLKKRATSIRLGSTAAPSGPIKSPIGQRYLA